MPYAFCESIHAGSNSLWHIRKYEGALKLGGGIDTPSLCGHVKPEVGGWDIAHIHSHWLHDPKNPMGQTCPECLRQYKAAIGVED